MKALVKYEAGSYKVKVMEVKKKEPGADQVRIKVSYAGICGTDVHILKDDGSYSSNPPITLGHELSGIIDMVGENVDSGLIGKRVVSETYYVTCGKCFYCKTGRNNLCAQRKSIGSGVDGAMAECVIVPLKNIHILPDSISQKVAAMTEPFTCCVQAVLEKSKINPKDKVLIAGPGSIGLMCMQVVKLFGAQVTVIGLSSDKERLELAEKLGADTVLYADSKDIGEQIQKECGVNGPDIIFECSGAGSSINLCLEMIRKGGRFVQVGLTGRPTEINMNLVTLKEIELYGTFATKSVWWDKAIDILSEGKVRLEPLISEVTLLDDWDKAFDLAIKGEGFKHMLSLEGN